MAQEYYGLNRGQTEFNVVNGTSTNSTDIEVRIDTSKNFTTSEIKNKLQEIYDTIIRNNLWPPA